MTYSYFSLLWLFPIKKQSNNSEETNLSCNSRVSIHLQNWCYGPAFGTHDGLFCKDFIFISLFLISLLSFIDIMLVSVDMKNLCNTF